jgi:hypothetical protein
MTIGERCTGERTLGGGMFDVISAVAVIREAIEQRRQLTFVAEHRYRLCCPHALGTKDGAWHVVVRQLNDDGAEHRAAGGSRWRCFALADLLDVRAHDGDWPADPPSTGRVEGTDDLARAVALNLVATASAS